MSSSVNYPTDSNPATVNVPTTTEKKPFLTKEDSQRMGEYAYFDKLLKGDHYDAFHMKIQSDQYNQAYSKLRYVIVNFAGMISKICADMLLGEGIRVRTADGKNMDFINAFIRENKLVEQAYEGSISTSALGDGLFKLRIGKRDQGDKESTVIAEDTTPRIYFPKLDPFNVRAEPDDIELAWVFKKDNQEYLRKEIHQSGKIINKVYKMEGQFIGAEMPLNILGIEGLEAEQDTKINRKLVIHYPNWRIGSSHFGTSDYLDLDSLFYAVNNRMSKIDNILDKHSDPILLVPDGVLDENGRVRKGTMGVVEIKDGENMKPEYVVWDASLENAFKEIEKLVEFIMMIGEVSPDVLGLGEGKADSGRALKFKLMRTIAKVNRKKLYMDRALKDLLYRAQELALAWGVKVGGFAVEGQPSEVTIDWADGLPIDESEQLDNETKALDAGITTKKASIMRTYHLTDEEAEKELKGIDEDSKKAMAIMPKMNMGKAVPTKPGEQKPPVNEK